MLVSTVAAPSFGPNTSSPSVRYSISRFTFIGCGRQPKNTIGSPLRAARSTWASIACSLDSTSSKSLSPNLSLAIISEMVALALLPASMP